MISQLSASVADSPLPPPFDDLYLSSLAPGDFPRLVDLYNNTDLSSILLSPPYPYTLADAQWFHDNRAHSPVPGHSGTHEIWVVRSRSHAGLLVGICGTHPGPEHPPGTITLGYFTAPEFRGRGIMPAVLNEVLQKFPGASFQAEAEAGNGSSQKVLQKAGFSRVEGSERLLEWPESKGGGFRNMWKYVKEQPSAE
ncbi:hypothetical protein DRE_01199 [Drechslerella stenobrocha 248]|uniref:N-acetyltransferase domain-containing protein n=1 Tax=Drechslerella stenobrocha 248 TaxID=1043628 RepID=W7HWQ0_9PEZI|nr:hypothetical protein DRE_01199 [Drechslerella stenobrocha 248]